MENRRRTNTDFHDPVQWDIMYEIGRTAFVKHIIKGQRASIGNVPTETFSLQNG